MSARGRRPKPTWMKVISGNPGNRKLNDDEPIPLGDLKDPPAWLADATIPEDRRDMLAESWRYAIEHAPPGLLRCLDRSVLATWVVADVLHRRAVMKVMEFGEVVKTPSGPMQSPYLSIANKQAQLKIRLESEMGFTPSSRSRVKVGKTKGAGNPFDDLKEITD